MIDTLNGALDRLTFEKEPHVVKQIMEDIFTVILFKIQTQPIRADDMFVIGVHSGSAIAHCQTMQESARKYAAIHELRQILPLIGEKIDDRGN